MDDLKFSIPLNPVTKKNSNVRTKNGMISSKAYRQYEKDAVRLIPGAAKKHIARRVNIKATYYMRTDYYDPARKSVVDLTNLHNALHDTLVAAGVLADDNCRIAYSTDGSTVQYDKKNPRTEVEIAEVGYEQTS